MNEVIKCPHGKDCGGCNLLGKKYSDTLDIKLNYVNDLFKEARIDYKIKECIPSPNYLAYRNKMIIGFKNLKGNVIAGFYEEGSHHIVNIDNCLMHTEAQNKIFRDFLFIIKKLHLEIYDEDKRFGLIRYLLIREAFTTGEIMVVIVTSTNIFPARANLVKELRRLNPNITTIIQSINPRKTSIVLGEEQRTLFGPGFIYDYIGDIKFRLGPKSFFQVNPAQAYNLYKEVKRLADLKACETVIDAYSGVSTISAFIAKDAKKVISIENNKEACLAGISNLKDNNIKNVYVENADATNYLVGEAKLHNKYDVVILDPPRIGSTPEFINAVASVGAKKVIYVSCGPNTLVRDLKLFINKGYKIREAKCFDMFCFSNHIEAIVKLDLKEI